ncbi:hypothetical protein [Flavobacterium lacisediminis]|uniref:Uncharacterized protein n=1 Tax=Flavobacterium lacisediminis TaxID=2989705 RepID=A0ABT3EJ03_9FLAO|nr:hypothetical protein [Flavobacterium lacisediminis]MCW1148542.1 hypothetical protein [Flavobacterium lacisediminis]
MRYVFLLVLLSSLRINAQENSGIIVFENNIKLHWTIKTFNKKEHQIKICNNNFGVQYICAIDNAFWYGSDIPVDKPKNQLTNLILEIGKNKIILDVSSMFNPNFSGELSIHQFKIIKEGNQYVLYGFFSDGAGTYTAHWRIVDTISIREVISNSEEYFSWQD